MTTRSAGLALAGGRGVLAWRHADAGSGGARAGAARTDAMRTEVFSFDATSLAAGDESALMDAMHALRRASAARTLHVALASPWSSARQVALPPMREHEARSVMVRDAARYFLAPHAEPVVATRALSRGTWLACDADGAVLDAITRAARTAGFEEVRFVAAAGAWAQAAGDATHRAFVVDDEATVISARSKTVTALRRCRAADLAGAAMTPGDALALAAEHAGCAERELVSAREGGARDGRARRTSGQLLLAGVILLLAALAVRTGGAVRRVNDLETRRAALRPAVAPFVAARDSLTRTIDALDALSQARSQSPSWGSRLLALASALPKESYFTSIRAEADSAIVEGRALDAALVIERLKTARGVRSVHATSQVIEGDGPVLFAAVVRFGDGGVP